MGNSTLVGRKNYEENRRSGSWYLMDDVFVFQVPMSAAFHIFSVLTICMFPVGSICTLVVSEYTARAISSIIGRLCS